LKRRFHEFKFGSRLIVWRGWKPEVIKTCWWGSMWSLSVKYSCSYGCTVELWRLFL
jgi:hypothetical protein